MATITSKRQLTVPAKIFNLANMRVGQKVVVVEDNGRVIITPAEMLVEELAGSVPIPKKWVGKDIDEIIEEAKDEYFSEKYKLK